MAGQCDEHLRWRKRDVQERSRWGCRSPAHAAPIAEREQVIVMHPDRVVILDQSADLIGKARC
jgi:hypothetical protein